MRIIKMTIYAIVLLLVAACGTPTEGTTGSGANEGATTATTLAFENGESGQAGSSAATPGPVDTPAGTNAMDAAGGTQPKQYSEPPAMLIDQSKSYRATITTSKGTMTAELFDDEAPLTVNNFVFLARENFYDGVRFHRIIKDFMVQTGDPNGDGTGGPGYQFADEPVQRDYEHGTLAMANSGANTNGSQFFIVHADYPLPKNYTIFGKVTDGLDTLDAIANTPVGPNPRGEMSMPQEEVIIEDIEIEEQ